MGRSRGPTFPLCNLFATILLLVIFTLICNDRNGARELHSYFADPSPSSSSSSSSRLFSAVRRIESIGFENNLLSAYAIPSGVARLYGCWPRCVRGPPTRRRRDYNGLPMISVAVFFVSGKQEAAMVSLDRWINLAE